MPKHEEMRARENGEKYSVTQFVADANNNYDFTCIEGLGSERNDFIHRYFRENVRYVIDLGRRI